MAKNKNTEPEQPKINAVTRVVPVGEVKKGVRPIRRARRKCCGG